MGLSKLAAKCAVCPYVDACDHKRMEAVGFLPEPPLLNSASQPAAGPASQPLLRETMEIRVYGKPVKRFRAVSAESNKALGPKRSEMARGQRAASVARPVHPPCADTGHPAGMYEGHGPLLLRQHPWPWHPLRQGSHRKMGGERPEGHQVHLHRRHQAVL